MYQVLYRKYRPRVFGDVYGQDHVTSTLKNEIKNGRISHAYLFTGSRGTGKTTCAKILAKAVNCENSHDGEPCNECEVCRALDSGAIYDVVEIDAASNNGVDNIRDLREEANYTPTRGKYRVYIIDEVHMLSTGAFNALLKTLEEPPAHVIFILATTEVHKLPATILSRCQRFDFKRIQPETMAVRLQQVAKMEGIALEDNAAILIARIADGALRDGLSILDQCAGRSKTVTSELVSEVAGLAGRDALYALSDCIAQHNCSQAMSAISNLYQNSYDMERLCVEMINHFRNLLMLKTVNKSRELIICTDDEYQLLQKAAAGFTLENIIYALDLFQDTLVTIKGGASARIEMEMAFVKLCEPKLEESTASLLSRIAALERSIKNGVVVSSAVPATDEPKETELPQEAAAPEPQKPVFEKPNESETPQQPQETDEAPLPKAVSNEPETPPLPEEQPLQPTGETVPFTEWAELMDVLHDRDLMLYSILAGSKGYIRDDFFLIDSPNNVIRDFIQKNNASKTIRKALFDITGKKFRLGMFKRQQNDKPQRDPLEDLIMKAQTKINVDIQ